MVRVEVDRLAGALLREPPMASGKRAPTRAVVATVSNFDEGGIARLRVEVERATDLGQPILPVVIDSFGGDIYALLAMVDVLDAARQHMQIATVAVGKAMSCGLDLLACGGDHGKRYVAPMASALLHSASGMEGGKVEELKAGVEEIERLNTLTFTMTEERCGKPKGFFRRLLERRGDVNVFLSAKEVVQYGLADHIGIPELRISIATATTLVLEEPVAPRRRRKKEDAT